MPKTDWQVARLAGPLHLDYSDPDVRRIAGLYANASAMLRSAADHVVTDYHDRAAALAGEYAQTERATGQFYEKFRKDEAATTPAADEAKLRR